MRKWWPLVAVCFGSFMFLVDTTVVAVALPDMARDLGGSLSRLQWVANVYTLVLAVLMLTAGSLADLHGHRRVYVGGLVVFATASLGCGLAPDARVLIAARAVQGVGGAAMAVTSFALIGACYRGRDMGTAMGVWGAVNGLGAAAGPMLGGVLTQTLGWRAVFWINLPLVVVTVVLTLRVVPGVRRPDGVRVDLPGTLSFALCAGSLTYALTRAGADGWGSVPVGAGLAGSAVGLVVFVVVERSRRFPLLDLSLFRRFSFCAVMLCVLASSAAFACLVYTSVWLQSALRLDPVRAGLGLVPLACTTFVVSTLGGRLLHRVPARWTVGTGLLLSGLGCALQSGLDSRSTALTIMPGLIVTGAGVGLMGPALGSAVMAAVPAARHGMAAGAMSTFRQLGQTLGVAALGVVFQTGLAGRLDGHVPDADGTAHTIAAGRAPDGPLVRAAVAHGLNEVYLLAAAVGLSAGFLALLTVRSPGPGPRRQP